MKRKSIVLLAFIALLAFACKNEQSANNTAGTTETTASSTTGTETTGTTASGTTGTSTSGMTAVTSTAPLNTKDADFAKTAAAGGMMEVDLGQLAAAKATGQDVKDFGNKMVTDHGKANDALKSIASQKGLTLPTTASDEEKKASNDLSKKSGTAFDKAYMSAMVKGHEAVLKDFQKAEKDVKDPDLKSWITNTIPAVQDHLKMAKEINGKLK